MGGEPSRQRQSGTEIIRWSKAPFKKTRHSLMVKFKIIVQVQYMIDRWTGSLINHLFFLVFTSAIIPLCSCERNGPFRPACWCFIQILHPALKVHPAWVMWSSCWTPLSQCGETPCWTLAGLLFRSSILSTAHWRSTSSLLALVCTAELNCCYF